MFIHADPARKRTQAERELEVSRIRSHAATHGHRGGKKKNKRATNIIASSTARRHMLDRRTWSLSNSEWNKPDACSAASEGVSLLRQEDRYSSLQLLFDPQLTVAEGTPAEKRSLRFFVECTAIEWPAWSDGYFWTTMVMQASTVHSCIRHGLVALAAAHEAIQESSPRSEWRYSWALQQGRQALNCLQEQYNTLSSASLLMSHILILALTTILDESLMYNAMKALYDFDTQLQQQMIQAPATVSRSDSFTITEYLKPLVERQKTKLGSLVDIMWSLQQSRASHFGSRNVDQTKNPKRFRSTEHARSVLDQLLNSIAHTVKTLMPQDCFPEAATQKMADWMSALGALQFRTLHQQCSEQSREICNIEILRLSAQVYLMLITIMHGGGSEMAFDQYTEVYRAIAKVARLVIAYKKSHGQSSVTIAMESSLISFVGNAASRWCRDSMVRQELFDALEQYEGREGYESAACWFDISNCMRKIEEAAVREPRTAMDIPEIARVHLVGAEFYLRSGGRMAIEYLQYPFRAEDNRVIILPYFGCGHFYTFDRFAGQLDAKPDVIIKRGYTSWLIHESGDEYYVVDHPRFYFRVTKV